jgi:predicted P-loop ATPase
MLELQLPLLQAAERPERLKPNQFPDKPIGNGPPPTTIANIEYLLKSGGYTAHYDVICKRHHIRNRDGTSASMNEILSLAVFNCMQQSLVFPFVLEVAERNPVNPVADWIRSRDWDGIDRLEELYDTVHAEIGYPEQLKKALLHRWLLSAVAAALSESGFKAAGVLTFQGGQGIGKTSWGQALVSDRTLRDQILKVDLHLDPGNKDSIMAAISSWIGEIGELDSSFRKDVARLKGFLTSDADRIRVPYGRAQKDYPRRTVFFATVNETNFLVDTTGNRRWWTIPVTKLDFQHTIDMQQVFAQLATEREQGEQWWLTPDEERMLAEENLKHRSVSVIAERILDYLDLDRKGQPYGVQMTAMQVLLALDFRNPTNAQCRECGTVLRELLGPPKRIQGRDRWRIHKRKGDPVTHLEPEDDDIY